MVPAEYNPLIKGRVRNLPCICGSGKKIKSCCGTKRLVPKQYADFLNRMKITQDETLMKELAAHKPQEGVMNGHTDERTQTR